eukprot:403340664
MKKSMCIAAMSIAFVGLCNLDTAKCQTLFDTFSQEFRHDNQELTQSTIGLNVLSKIVSKGPQSKHESVNTETNNGRKLNAKQFKEDNFEIYEAEDVTAFYILTCQEQGDCPSNHTCQDNRCQKHNQEDLDNALIQPMTQVKNEKNLKLQDNDNDEFDSDDYESCDSDYDCEPSETCKSYQGCEKDNKCKEKYCFSK